MRGRLSTRQVKRDSRDMFETFKFIQKRVFSQRYHLKIYKCEELSERTLSEHALVYIFDVISRFYFIKELRPSLIASYLHENHERKNEHIMLSVPSHDLNEYFLDYYV